MEIVLYISAFLFVGIMGFLFIEKPYIFASVFIFLNVYKFNVDLPGPLDLRGMITLLLFVRLFVFDKNNIRLVQQYLFREKYFWLILFFTLASYVITYVYFPKFSENLKLFSLNLITLILGFLIIINNKENRAFFYGFLAIGILSTIDLFFSRWVMGTLHVYKVLNVLRGNMKAFNHNMFGMMAGFGFLYTYIKLVRNEVNKIIFVPILLFLGLGLILSTSRGSMLGVIIAFFVINYFEGFKLFTAKRIIIFTGVFALFALLVSFSLSFLSSSTIPGSKLIYKMSQRLSEIPKTLMGEESAKYTKFGKREESTISWRLKKWQRDLDKFTERDLTEQLLGTGIGSYEYFGKVRYMAGSGDRQVYAAHNGYINVLIERGSILLLLYFIIMVGLIIKSLSMIKRYQTYNPLVYIYISLLIGAHALIANDIAYLFFGAIIGSFYFDEYYQAEDYDDDEDEEFYEEEFEEEEPKKLLGGL